MNSDQVQSIIRNILVGLGSSGVVLGVTVDASSWLAIASGVAALVGVLWGQFFHSGETKAQLAAPK